MDVVALVTTIFAGLGTLGNVFLFWHGGEQQGKLVELLREERIQSSEDVKSMKQLLQNEQKQLGRLQDRLLDVLIDGGEE